MYTYTEHTRQETINVQQFKIEPACCSRMRAAKRGSPAATEGALGCPASSGTARWHTPPEVVRQQVAFAPLAFEPFDTLLGAPWWRLLLGRL